jgi:hypothetical protein
MTFTKHLPEQQVNLKPVPSCPVCRQYVFLFSLCIFLIVLLCHLETDSVLQPNKQVVFFVFLPPAAFYTKQKA